MRPEMSKCKNCGASVEIDEGRDFCFCKYCGSKVLLDNGKKEITINKNINENVNKNINKNVNITKNDTHTTHHIDEAAVIRAKNEERQDKRNSRHGFILLGLMLLIPLAILGGVFISKNQAKNEGKISAGYYQDFIGESYEFVVAHFEAAGFTDIELIDLDDAGITFWKEGKVSSVSVGGDADFDSTDWFYPDTKVVIAYH